MIGLGTIINTAGIIIAGVAGHFIGKLFKESHQQTMCTACGVSTIFIGIAGAMEGMLTIKDEKIVSTYSMLVVVCIILGALVGEIINFDGLFEKFAEWLKVKTGNAKDPKFVEGFITASLTVCIGAMAMVGSIQDGIKGDFSILLTKTILDVIIIIVMSSTFGKGCAFSALPVFVIQGTFTLLAVLIKPVMTDLALGYLSMIGSILISCVGINLIWGKKIKVANFIPSIIFAVIAAFIPIWD